MLDQRYLAERGKLDGLHIPFPDLSAEASLSFPEALEEGATLRIEIKSPNALLKLPLGTGYDGNIQITAVTAQPANDTINVIKNQTPVLQGDGTATITLAAGDTISAEFKSELGMILIHKAP